MSNGLITNKYSLLQLEESQKRICATYKLEGQELKNVDKEKDLRVTINKNLNAKDHINNLAGRARAWWANIQVAYSHLEGQNTDNPVSQTKFGICHCSMELTIYLYTLGLFPLLRGVAESRQFPILPRIPLPPILTP